VKWYVIACFKKLVQAYLSMQKDRLLITIW